MPLTYTFYMDDSGTRDPNRTAKPKGGGVDWFGLGGILVRDRDKDTCKNAIREMRKRFPFRNSFLHSSEIRVKRGAFAWLCAPKRNPGRAFEDALEELMVSIPVVGMACVVDRHGHYERYKDYGENQWSLDKTAFSIAVERAAKFASARGHKLQVNVERSDKKTEADIRGYYKDLRKSGMPFDKANSEGYKPAQTDLLQSTLYDLRFQTKEPVLMQMADLYLYPMCQGGRDPDYPLLRKLRNAGRLIDAHVDDQKLGIKYSCFDDLKANAER